MKYRTNDKYDSVVLGTIAGLLVPTVGFFSYYFIRYSGMYFPAFIRYLYNGGTFIPILSLCVVPNLLVFFTFIWTDRDRSARGVLQATFLFAIYVCIMKLI